MGTGPSVLKHLSSTVHKPEFQKYDPGPLNGKLGKQGKPVEKRGQSEQQGQPVFL